MKIKDIVDTYHIDEASFVRFLVIKNLPYKSTFSGIVVADENLEQFIRDFKNFEIELKQRVNKTSEQKKQQAEQLKQKLKILFTLEGSRGRTLTVCKNKCIIKTNVTVGSVVTGNATDGEKIIFFKHCAGLQFKESGLAIGYLQFETPSMQMNNQSSNFFSENTFTFEEKNGISNSLMREVFYYVMELVENSASGADFDIPEYPHLLQEYINTNK